MKILIAIYKYFYHGGLQQDTRRLIEEALKRGHEVTVFTTEWANPPAEISVEKVPVRGISNVARMKNFTVAWQKRLKTRDYDVSVAMSRIPGADFYFAADTCMAVACRRKHSEWMLKLLPRYRYILSNEEAVIGRKSKSIIMCLTTGQMDAFKCAYGIPDERMRLLPPGMNPACVFPGNEKAIASRRKVREKFGISESTIVLVSVGSGFELKGFDRTAVALASLSPEISANVHWIVVGNANANKFNATAKKLGIEGNCHLAGVRQDVNEILLASDLVVHPAREEGAGSSLVEGVSSHVPVICTEVCGFAPFVAASGGVVLAEPFMQENLNRALAEAIENLPDLTRTVAEYAEQHDFTARAGAFVDELEKFCR